jgi:hypothetical protein
MIIANGLNVGASQTQTLTNINASTAQAIDKKHTRQERRNANQQARRNSLTPDERIH